MMDRVSQDAIRDCKTDLGGWLEVGLMARWGVLSGPGDRWR